MNNIFHFIEMNDEDVKLMYSKHSSSHTKNYDSYVDNNMIKMYNKNKNIIFENNILDIEISLIVDEEMKNYIMKAKK